MNPIILTPLMYRYCINNHGEIIIHTHYIINEVFEPIFCLLKPGEKDYHNIHPGNSPEDLYFLFSWFKFKFITTSLNSTNAALNLKIEPYRNNFVIC